jgi:hypothetical protein
VSGPLPRAEARAAVIARWEQAEARQQDSKDDGDYGLAVAAWNELVAWKRANDECLRASCDRLPVPGGTYCGPHR